MSEAGARPTAEFQLAILGGCMTHQVGIPFNSLYQRQLARDVEAETGVRLRAHVARAFGQDLVTRLDMIDSRFAVDGVLLHLRVVVTRRGQLLVIHKTANGRRWRPHPALFDRRHTGTRVAALRALENAAADEDLDTEARRARQAGRRGRWIGNIRLRNLNMIGGGLFGLDRWAIDDEMHQLAEFAAVCSSRDLPLFVLGPTPLKGQPWAARSIDRLNDRIADFCAESALPFALIDAKHDAQGHQLLMQDGVHLTAEGHRFVADRLLGAGFAGWVKRSDATRSERGA